MSLNSWSCWSERTEAKEKHYDYHADPINVTAMKNYLGDPRFRATENRGLEEDSVIVSDNMVCYVY